ncbi:MAG: hydrogenase [Thermoplasmatota archaeon]
MATSLLAPETVIDALSALFVVAALVLMSHKSLSAAVRMFAVQSAILAAIATIIAIETREWHILVLAAVTLALKGYALPRFFDYLIDRIRIKRESEPYVNLSVGLVIAGGLILAAYWIVRPIQIPAGLLAKHSLTASLGVVFIGFFIMASRRKAVTQTLGLLVMENGMFLAALSLTYGMPLIVELGIAFDVLVAGIVVGIFIFNINRTFDTVDSSRLDTLID